jgi:hypothetical protein
MASFIQVMGQVGPKVERHVINVDQITYVKASGKGERALLVFGNGIPALWCQETVDEIVILLDIATGYAPEGEAS